MIKILDEHEKSQTVLTVAIGGLTLADWEKVIPELQKRIQQYGRIRWYFEMDDFREGSTTATWEDVGFDKLKKDGFERIAIVGSKDWQGWMKDMMKPFVSTEIRFFETIHQEKAHQWIRG